MTSQTIQTTDSRLLRIAIRGNAVFSAISGLIFIVDAGLLASTLGGLSKANFFSAGIMLLGFAVALAILSLSATINRTGTIVVIILDALWVVGSAVLLVTKVLPFTPVGVWAVAIVADIVAIFAIVQYLGLRKMSRG